MNDILINVAIYICETHKYNIWQVPIELIKTSSKLQLAVMNITNTYNHYVYEH